MILTATPDNVQFTNRPSQAVLWREISAILRRLPAPAPQSGRDRTWRRDRAAPIRCGDMSDSLPLWDALPVSEKHRAELIASAIASEVAKERGYQSITTKRAVMKLGFRESQANVPGWLAPMHNIAGELADYTFKPDSPRIKDGKSVKYEQIVGHAPIVDVPPRARPWVMDPKQALFFTEGIKKGDSGASHELAIVMLLGVWNWKSSEVIAALDRIPLKGRAVYIAFDSDWRRKPGVRQALNRLISVLRQAGAIVAILDLPEPTSGIKVGLDDYFAADPKHNATTLLRYASEADDPIDDPDDDAETGAYAVRNGCIAYRKRERDGDVWLPLCNFNAEIVAQVIADNGVEEHGSIALRGQLATGKALPLIEVSFSRFASLDWVISKWGAGAVINAGMGANDRLREAIQRLSPDVPIRRVYTHPGWRKIDGRWVFLHRDGAIGPQGTFSPERVEVRLNGPAERLCLPVPPTDAALIAAIATVLSVRDVAPDRLSSLVLALPFAAPLLAIHPIDTGVYLLGPTGSLKSELNALTQRFFGPAFDRETPPGTYLDTPNALEKLVFDCKDAVCWIDDFAPTGSAFDIQRYHGTAERLFRGIGNQSGRGRLNQNLESRPVYVPRGLVISSGEDVPHMQSALARVVIAEVKHGDVNQTKLAVLQAEPARSQFAASTAAYVQWLAPQLDSLRTAIGAEHLALRASLTGDHLRTPDAIAHLALGWRLWLRFAVEVGALTPAAEDAAWQRALAGLKEAGQAQAGHQEPHKPAIRFIELLMSAIARGDAYVATTAGDQPDNFPA
ncbi:MAG: DUF3854 domain-containing protein [Thermomicrobiales bacterium]